MKFNPLVFMAFSLAVFFLPSTPIAAQDAKDSAGSKVYDSNVVNKQPTPKGKRAAPVYPYEMRRIKGKVTLQFIVDEKGFTRDIQVVQSSHQKFEKPAIDAVQQWRFKPAQKDGKPVRCRMQIPINFDP